MKGLFLGLTTVDVIYPIESYPREDSKTNVAELHSYLGGPATNAAIAFAALGGDATLISPVGNGPWANFIKVRLTQFNVNHIDLAEGQDFTPTISSILSNRRSGLRTIFTSKAKALGAVSVPPINAGKFDVYCLDGFHDRAALSLLEQKPRNVPVVFDGGSYKVNTEGLLQHVHYPIFSERFKGPEGITLQQFALKNAIATYAITHGSASISLIKGDRRIAIPVKTVKAVDTLAAGDIFHGAFSWFILQAQSSFENALIQSSEIAALSCEFLGPRAWIEKLP